MVTDQELASCVESLLRQHQIPPPSSSATVPSPPDSADRAAATAATVAGVLRHLEAKLGLDLSHKAAFIQRYVDLLLHPPSNIDSNTQQLQNQVPTVTSSFLQCSPPMTSAHDVSFRYAASPVQQVQFHQQEQVPVRPATAVVTSPKPRPSVPKQSAPIKRRGGPGGLNKVCGVSPELQAIVGEPTMARTEIVKQLWAYIRRNNLQDPNNKRKIICNDQLRIVFETDCTDMFKMNKLLAKHIIPLEQTRGPVSDLKRLKSEEIVPVTKPEQPYAPAPTLVPVSDPAIEAVPAVGPASAPASTPAAAPISETDIRQCPMIMSEALANFLESEEKQILQSEALKRIWDYIKDNNLEDPMDTMTIICDPRLQELLGCETFSALAISELLVRHLRKQS